MAKCASPMTAEQPTPCSCGFGERPLSSRTRPRKREEGNFLAGVGVGVLMGLAVSLGIAFYLNRTPLPFMSAAKPKQAEKNGTGAPKPPPIAVDRVAGVRCVKTVLHLDCADPLSGSDRRGQRRSVQA